MPRAASGDCSKFVTEEHYSSYRRLRRRADKVRRHVASPSNEARVVVREVEYVERLAYTRSQAAEALGVGRSTFVRRVLPYVETIETP
jgi:hypothetical protein